MPMPPVQTREFSSLKYITECLRGEEGCPWDREQTHESLTRFAIEEAFELAEAIESGNVEDLKGELGDVLFQVLLHSEIAKQEGHFQIEDVIQTLNEKMIRRHPHVFSDTKVKDSSEVLKNWSEIKSQENLQKKKTDLFSTPKGLPSLLEAFKIGEKTRGFAFDWLESGEVMNKVDEELMELKEAITLPKATDQDIDFIEHEIGDLLFSVAQFARHLKVDPEQALRKANQRFRKRFQTMMDIQKCSVEEFKNLSSEVKETLWSKAKAQESSTRSKG